MPSSFSTPVTLLERLSDPQDKEARERFALYCQRPITVFAKKVGVERDDIPDFVQEAFLRVFKVITGFRYNDKKRFRGWLFTLVRNQKREWNRKRLQGTEEPIGELEDVEDGDAADLEHDEFTKHVTQQALRVMQKDFETKTWQACWEAVVNERKAEDIAKELGLTANAVYKARHNVLRRLRQELEGILD